MAAGIIRSLIYVQGNDLDELREEEEELLQVDGTIAPKSESERSMSETNWGIGVS